MQQYKDITPLAHVEGVLTCDVDGSEPDADADHGVSRIPRFGLDFDLIPPRRKAKFPFFRRRNRKSSDSVRA